MRVGCYLKGYENEPKYIEIDIKDLLQGSNIREALEQLGITKNNFSSGFIELTDVVDKMTVKFSFKDYDEFELRLWFIRQKLKRD